MFELARGLKAIAWTTDISPAPRERATRRGGGKGIIAAGPVWNGPPMPAVVSNRGEEFLTVLPAGFFDATGLYVRVIQA